MKKIATKWEVKIEGEKRSIQLYDKDGVKLDGENARWDGDFDCSSNQLTSLGGSPKEVGGDFSCSNNQLTSLGGAPKGNSDMFPLFLKKGYLFSDNILTKIISKKKSGKIVLWRTRKIGSDKVIFVAQKGDMFSHGEMPKQAIHDLRYKLADRDTGK